MFDKDLIARVAEPNVVQAYAKSASYLARMASTQQSAAAPAGDLAKAEPANVGSAQLQQVLGEIRAEVQNVQRALQFSIDEESGTTIVKVIDSQTREVIRQIPAEEVLSIASRMRAAAGGLLLADTV